MVTLTVFRSRECWFCLSSPNVESHLITSVGEYYYCALAKGPLVPDHVLIMPIEHTPNTLSLPLECEKELEQLQSSLKAYFKKQGKEIVFFEWVFKRGSHANLQVWNNLHHILQRMYAYTAYYFFKKRRRKRRYVYTTILSLKIGFYKAHLTLAYLAFCFSCGNNLLSQDMMAVYLCCSSFLLVQKGVI